VQTRSRRALGWALLLGGSAAVAGAALGGTVAGDLERVDRYWARAVVAGDGGAEVVEMIDYDFGNSFGKHGIERFVPGQLPSGAITVDSPRAPDGLQLIPEFRNGREYTNIRIGDAAVTVSGRQRYRIGYQLPGVERDDVVDWEAVGAEWRVDIEDAEVHLLTPYELADARCIQGPPGSTEGCELRQVEPGHVVATIDKVPKGEGVSIEGRVGASLAAAPTPPEPPATPPDDPGTGLLPPTAAAAAGALVAGVPATLMVRRSGRERVAAGGQADAAYAAGPDPGAPVSEVRVDAAELARMATTEFAPPAGVRPEQGGIILTEDVRQEHKVAWLIQAAVDGAVDLDEHDGTVTLTRTGPGTVEDTDVLDMAFRGRDRFDLDGYDRDFASAWGHLSRELDRWRLASGLWDRRAEGTRLFARVVGILSIVVGALAAAGGGALSGRFGATWLPLAAAGGALAGAGIAAAVGAWELRVRTPQGSGLWLRVESFRRFLAESEAYHAEEAAKRGVLREYTAWAVAVGEIDRWSRAVAASSVIPETAGVHYAYMAPYLLASTTSAATAPSSSGSGGGFSGGFGGGSIGGGAGGGGGGSW
jgi:hypothetical protein